MKLFFVTGESSGDIHAASLLNELYKILPKEHLIVKAIGGKYLQDAGAEIYFDCKHLGSMGLTEVISKLPMYLNLERELLFELSTFRPDVLILVDFPGFNLRIAQKIKKKSPDTKVVYYLPPQVWAWNQSRTKLLSKYCDLVLCGLPFEEDFHKIRGVNAFYVGNPIVSELESYNRDELRNQFGLSKSDVLVGLFPGSRTSEIHYMLPVLLKASSLLCNVRPNYRFMLAQASTISNLETTVKDILNKNDLTKVGDKIKILPPGNNHKLLCASDFLWLTSGTVTLEAALYETPMILGYKGNAINYLLYLILKRVNMIGLPNLIVGEKIVPELLQYDATPDNYYQTTKEWIEVHGHLQKIKTNLKKVREKITDKNASKEAALKIMELIKPHQKLF